MADQCLSHIAGLGTKYPHTLSVDCCVWSLKKQSWWADSLPITAICHSTKVCGYYTAVSPRSLELELQTAPLHMGQPNLWAAAVLHGPVPKSQGPFKHCWLMMALRNSSAFAHLLSATLNDILLLLLHSFRSRKGKIELEDVLSYLQAQTVCCDLPWLPKCVCGIYEIRFDLQTIIV